MATLLPKERTALVESINTAMASLKGHADERHHLLNVLGFVTSSVHEAKAATTMSVLQKQIDLLVVQISDLQSKGNVDDTEAQLRQ